MPRDLQPPCRRSGITREVHMTITTNPTSAPRTTPTALALAAALAVPRFSNPELRERINSILAAPESRGREALALLLVKQSGMTSSEAIATLRTAGRDSDSLSIDTAGIYDRLNAIGGGQ